MKDRIINFLNDLNDTLAEIADGKRFDIYHIGRSALVWKYDFQSTTGDIDILQPRECGPMVAKAMEAFGHDSPKAKIHGLYLQCVPEGLPPIAGGAYQRAQETPEKWSVIRLFHLEPNDMAVTKFKRFAPKDQEDVRMMCDMELLDPDVLEARLEAAWRYVHEKDGDADRDRAFQSLRIVQRYLRDGEWSTA